jgi:hypothetical protein
MIDVKIRFNTQCRDERSFWRILINGVEKICASVILECSSYTTLDEVWDPGRKEMVQKHHISCQAQEVLWKGNIVIIK